MSRVSLRCLSVLVCGAWLAGVAPAGVIDAFDIAAGPGLGAANVLELATPAPNNDNSDGSAPINAINIDKRFDKFGYIDMQFIVSNSRGTTEYFIDDVVTNNSGVKWWDYHFELGFGLGAGFVTSNLTDFLDFDAPDRDPKPTSTDFTQLLHESNTIDWSKGMINFFPNPGSVSRQFLLSIDVPDFSDEMPADAAIYDPAGAIVGYAFTLRQYPTPEPASMALAAVGLAALVALRARRRGV